MADDEKDGSGGNNPKNENKGSSGSPGIRIERVEVNEANVNKLTFERLDPKTGSPKSAESDLLDDILGEMKGVRTDLGPSSSPPAFAKLDEHIHQLTSAITGLATRMTSSISASPAVSTAVAEMEASASQMSTNLVSASESITASVGESLAHMRQIDTIYKSFESTSEKIKRHLSTFLGYDFEMTRLEKRREKSITDFQKKVEEIENQFSERRKTLTEALFSGWEDKHQQTIEKRMDEKVELERALRDLQKEYRETKDQKLKMTIEATKEALKHINKELKDLLEKQENDLSEFVKSVIDGRKEEERQLLGLKKSYESVRKSLEEEQKNLVKKIEEIKPDIVDFFRENVISPILNTAVTEFTNASTKLRQSFVRLTNELMSFEKITRSLENSFFDRLDISSTGLNTMDELFFKPFMGLYGRDVLEIIGPYITESVSRGLGPIIGAFGDDAVEIAETMFELRHAILERETPNAAQFVSYEDAVRLIQVIARREYTLLQDQGLDQAYFQDRIAQQLEFLRIISSNTGISAEELVRMNERFAGELERYFVAGSLNAQQVENVTRLNMAISQYLPTFQDEILNVLARYGGNVDMAIARDERLKQAVAYFPQIYDLLNETAVLMRKTEPLTGEDIDRYIDSLVTTSRAVKEQSERFGAAAGLFSDKLLQSIVDAYKIPENLEFKATLEEDSITELARTIERGFKENVGPVLRDTIKDTIYSIIPKIPDLLVSLAASGYLFKEILPKLGLGGLFRGAGRLLGSALTKTVGLATGAVASAAASGKAKALASAPKGSAGARRALGIKGSAVADEAAETASKASKAVRGRGAAAKARMARLAGRAAGTTGAASVAGAASRGGRALGLLKGGASVLGKAAPGIGFVTGVGMGAKYLWEGEYEKAGLSALAGLLSFVPGWGTASSLAISGTLAASDMASSGEQARQQVSAREQTVPSEIDRLSSRTETILNNINIKVEELVNIMIDHLNITRMINDSLSQMVGTTESSFQPGNITIISE